MNPFDAKEAAAQADYQAQKERNQELAAARKRAVLEAQALAAPVRL